MGKDVKSQIPGRVPGEWVHMNIQLENVLEVTKIMQKRSNLSMMKQISFSFKRWKKQIKRRKYEFIHKYCLVKKLFLLANWVIQLQQEWKLIV